MRNCSTIRSTLQDASIMGTRLAVAFNRLGTSAVNQRRRIVRELCTQLVSGVYNVLVYLSRLSLAQSLHPG